MRIERPIGRSKETPKVGSSHNGRCDVAAGIRPLRTKPRKLSPEGPSVDQPANQSVWPGRSTHDKRHSGKGAGARETGDMGPMHDICKLQR